MHLLARHVSEEQGGTGKPTLTSHPYGRPKVWVIPQLAHSWLSGLKSELTTARTKLTAAEAQQKSLVAEKGSLELRLSAARTRQAGLEAALSGDIALPMSLLQSDRFGLGVAGGLFGFAYTCDAPLLFGSASGVDVMFYGVNGLYFLPRLRLFTGFKF